MLTCNLERFLVQATVFWTVTITSWFLSFSVLSCYSILAQISWNHLLMWSLCLKYFIDSLIFNFLGKIYKTFHDLVQTVFVIASSTSPYLFSSDPGAKLHYLQFLLILCMLFKMLFCVYFFWLIRILSFPSHLYPMMNFFLTLPSF